MHQAFSFCSLHQRHLYHIHLGDHQVNIHCEVGRSQNFTWNLVQDWKTLGKRTAHHRPQILQALGKNLLRQNQNLTLWDLSFGFGQDALFLLFGAQQIKKILAFEEHPLLAELGAHLLKQNEIERLKDLELIHFNSWQWMHCTQESADILYFDPMYHQAANAKSLPHLGMQILRDWTANSQESLEDEKKNLQLAKLHARQKVIIKRPIKAPYYADTKPSLQIKGESTRFDVYFGASE